MHDRPSIFAIDFGTSNSLLAAAAPGRLFAPALLDPDANDPTVLRSALYFSERGESAFGTAAQRAFVANGLRGRLMRSIKRHLPSRTFTSTTIGSRSVSLEEQLSHVAQVIEADEQAELHADGDAVAVLHERVPQRAVPAVGDHAIAIDQLQRRDRRAPAQLIRRDALPQPEHELELGQRSEHGA